MMSARYRFQHLASLVFRHGPDVGLMSFPMSSLSDIGLMSARYRFRHQTSVVFRHRPDIVDDIWPTSSPRANMESARYQPTFADIGPIYFADIRLCRGRHLPISGRHRASMVFRNRPDIESISARCRPDIVDDIWPISARYILPTSGCCRGRHLPISGRHRASMVFRHRPDIESISARCRPDIVDDIWPTSSPRANMESARYQPTFADIGPI